MAIGRGLGGFDDADDFIHIGQRHRQAFEDMAAIARLLEFEHRAPGDDLAPVAQEGIQHVLQVEQARLAVDQRHHVHAEGILHLRLLVQIVQDHIRVFAAFQFDIDPHPGLVGFIAQVGDAVDLLVAHQFTDLDQQIGLVHLIRQFIDDDRLLAADLVHVLDMARSAHHHPAAAGAITILHPGGAVDDAGRWEIRRRHDLDQFVDRGFWILEQGRQRIADFREVVRRDIGRHAHRNA